MHQSVFTSKTDVTRDIQIRKNLQDLFTIANHRIGSERAENRRIQSKVWSSLQCSMQIQIRRPMGLQWKAEEFTLESSRICARSWGICAGTWRICVRNWSLHWKPGGGVQGEIKDWSSSEETEAHLSFLTSLLYHPWDILLSDGSSTPSGVKLLNHFSQASHAQRDTINQPSQEPKQLNENIYYLWLHSQRDT